jgi:hypothetical protein
VTKTDKLAESPFMGDRGKIPLRGVESQRYLAKNPDARKGIREGERGKEAALICGSGLAKRTLRGLSGDAGQQGVLVDKTPSWQRKLGLEMVNLTRRFGNKPTG